MRNDKAAEGSDISLDKLSSLRGILDELRPEIDKVVAKRLKPDGNVDMNVLGHATEIKNLLESNLTGLTDELGEILTDIFKSVEECEHINLKATRSIVEFSLTNKDAQAQTLIRDIFSMLKAVKVDTWHIYWLINTLVCKNSLVRDPIKETVAPLIEISNLLREKGDLLHVFYHEIFGGGTSEYFECCCVEMNSFKDIISLLAHKAQGIFLNQENLQALVKSGKPLRNSGAEYMVVKMKQISEYIDKLTAIQCFLKSDLILAAKQLLDMDDEKTQLIEQLRKTNAASYYLELQKIGYENKHDKDHSFLKSLIRIINKKNKPHDDHHKNIRRAFGTLNEARFDLNKDCDRHIFYKIMEADCKISCELADVFATLRNQGFKFLLEDNGKFVDKVSHFFSPPTHSNLLTCFINLIHYLKHIDFQFSSDYALAFLNDVLDNKKDITKLTRIISELSRNQFSLKEEDDFKLFKNVTANDKADLACEKLRLLMTIKASYSDGTGKLIYSKCLQGEEDKYFDSPLKFTELLVDLTSAFCHEDDNGQQVIQGIIMSKDPNLFRVLSLFKNRSLKFTAKGARALLSNIVTHSNLEEFYSVATTLSKINFPFEKPDAMAFLDEISRSSNPQMLLAVLNEFDNVINRFALDKANLPMSLKSDIKPWGEFDLSLLPSADKPWAKELDTSRRLLALVWSKAYHDSWSNRSKGPSALLRSWYLKSIEQTTNKANTDIERLFVLFTAAKIDSKYLKDDFHEVIRAIQLEVIKTLNKLYEMNRSSLQSNGITNDHITNAGNILNEKPTSGPHFFNAALGGPALYREHKPKLDKLSNLLKEPSAATSTSSDSGVFAGLLRRRPGDANQNQLKESSQEHEMSSMGGPQ